MNASTHSQPPEQRRWLRRLLSVFVTLPLVAIVAIAAWAVWLLDLNDHKRVLQQAAATHLGVELIIDGAMDHSIGRTLSLSAAGVQVRDGEREVATLDQIRIELALAPLLRGHIVIERIQGHATQLDLEWDPSGRFDLLPVLTADTGSDSGNQELPGWLQALRIERIDATLGDGRYHDRELGFDLAMKNATVGLGPLPIIDNGRLVADTPALFGAYRSHIGIEADELRLWNLSARQVELALDNDHGTLNFAQLRAGRLGLSGGDDNMLQASGAQLGGRLELDYGIPMEQLADTPWDAAQRVDLAEVSFSARRIDSGNDKSPLFEGLRASAPLVSLIQGLQSPDRAVDNPSARFAALLPKGLSARGRKLSLNNLDLSDYSVAITGGDTLSVRLDQGQLQVTLPDHGSDAGSGDNARRVSAGLQGNATIAMRGHGSPDEAGSLPLQALDLATLELTTTDVAFGVPGNSHRAALLTIGAGGLPIIHDGRLLDPARPADLAEAGRALKLTLSARNITHDREADHIDAVSAAVEGRRKALALTSFSAQFGDTSLTGSGEIELGGPDPTNAPTWAPAWGLELDSSGVSIRELAELTDLPLTPDGPLAVNLELSGQGFSEDQLTHTLDGHVLLSSGGMDLLDLDLDKLLTHLQYTQHGNLLDVSLFLLTGPAGSLVLAASDLDEILNTAEAQGHSRILAMRSEVRFSDGVLNVDEAALTTSNHRLAIQGSLSLYDDGPLDLEVATVDHHGCALFRERISGTLAEPDISHAGVLTKALLQPLKTLAGKVLPGKRCIEPFYSGVVPPPPEQAEPQQNTSGEETAETTLPEVDYE